MFLDIETPRGLICLRWACQDNQWENKTIFKELKQKIFSQNSFFKVKLSQFAMKFSSKVKLKIEILKIKVFFCVF